MTITPNTASHWTVLSCGIVSTTNAVFVLLLLLLLLNTVYFED